MLKSVNLLHKQGLDYSQSNTTVARPSAHVGSPASWGTSKLNKAKYAVQSNAAGKGCIFLHNNAEQC